MQIFFVIFPFPVAHFHKITSYSRPFQNSRDFLSWHLTLIPWMLAESSYNVFLLTLLCMVNFIGICRIFYSKFAPLVKVQILNAWYLRWWKENWCLLNLDLAKPTKNYTWTRAVYKRIRSAVTGGASQIECFNWEPRTRLFRHSVEGILKIWRRAFLWLGT